MRSIFYIFLIHAAFGLIMEVASQYSSDSIQYKLAMEYNTKSLIGEINSNPDVNLMFYPERAYYDNTFYVYDYPITTKYVISIIINPCFSNAPDCCMNVYGSPEYPALLKSGLQQERVYKYIVIANKSEVSKNYYLVDELGNSIASSTQRTPADYQVWNNTCTAKDEPYGYCQGRNYELQKSPLRPACEDNNATVNIMDGCVAPNGTVSNACLALAYTSTTFIPQCGVNDNAECGTYLEIHIPHGTPYSLEEDVISEVLVDQRNVTGFYTTIIPTTWKNNQTKVLCSYTESRLRIGSIVYIKESAPVCCCPPPFQPTTRVGSFQCPKGATANGAFGYKSLSQADSLALDTLLMQYPFCPIDINSNIDRMMCSVYEVKDRRIYSRNCTKVTWYNPLEARSWTSIDLQGKYNGKCPYYDSCGLTLDAGKCINSDLRFTFIGQVGIVTALDNLAAIPQVWVTFNNNRTSYQFSQTDVVLELYKSMYEIWWVVRSKTNRTVQKRKGFNITHPQCTYDSTNARYFPYAILDEKGDAKENSPTP